MTTSERTNTMTKEKTMNHTNRLPQDFWKPRLQELKSYVNTMTNGEIAKKFGITSEQVMSAMSRFQVRRENQQATWKSREKELCLMAQRMTAHEMAKHFGTGADNMYAQLRKLGIVAISSRQESRFTGGVDALVESAKTMSEKELCEKFGIDHRTVRKHLKSRGVEGIREKRKMLIWDEVRMAQIVKMRAEGKTVIQLAEHFNATPRYVRNRMLALGISTREVVAQKPKQPIVKKEVAPKKSRLRSLAPSLPGRVHGSAVYVPKQKPAPVQIIMPANVKHTISYFSPPQGANTRICNGSSVERYDPKARTVSVRGGY